MPNLNAGSEKELASRPQKSSTVNATKTKSYNWRYIKYLLKKKVVIEVMILGVDGESDLWEGAAKRTVVGHFDNIKSLKKFLIDLKKHKIEYESVFVTFNKSKKESYSNIEVNRLSSKGKRFKDEDIALYKFLFVDVDSVSKERPYSKAALSHCGVVAKKIRKDLKKIGFPTPVVINSGNGYHLFYPLKQVRNNPENVKLIKAFLKQLDDKYSDNEAKIDVKVGNPLRYGRLPGTVNGKTNISTKKPRTCKVVYCPSKILSMSLTKFKRVSKKLSVKWEEQSSSSVENVKQGSEVGRYQLDVEAYLSHYHVNVVEVIKLGTATQYIIDPCMFNSEHASNKASIVQQETGKLSYQCFHDSCEYRTWHEARKKSAARIL